MKSDFVGIYKADLISSEAKPKISSALADFILASARISFLQEFEFIRKNGKNIFFVAYRQKTTDSDRNLSFSTKCAFRRVKFALQVKLSCGQ